MSETFIRETVRTVDAAALLKIKDARISALEKGLEEIARYAMLRNGVACDAITDIARSLINSRKWRFKLS